ncbi:MAG TPA: Lrp/AsnC ligand binding domain-containing protein [Rhodothermales bacterium]|nr:Lrp/AsnC ligand binding domain-containing protein [Rhodothermales bacterium]
MMVTAIVLITTARGKVNEVAEQLVDLDGVSEVHSVAGRYDLVAIIRVKNNERLADVVTNHIRQIAGIERSETLIGFRVYSRHDLERLFSVGLED